MSLAQTFSNFEKEIIKALNGVRMSAEFQDIMIGYFIDGLTAEQALIKFSENKHKELERGILTLANL